MGEKKTPVALAIDQGYHQAMDGVPLLFIAQTTHSTD